MRESSTQYKKNIEIYRQVALLHIEGINMGFLATLGLPFLTLLYEAIDRSPRSILIAVQDGDRVIGFVSGTSSMKPIYKQLLYRFPQLLYALSPSLLNPRRLQRILEILRYSRSAPQREAQVFPAFELLSIVVAPDVRGRGCAETLYKRLVQYCGSQGIDAFKIVVGDSLLPAHRFYKRMGAVACGRLELHKGEDSVIYVQKIPRKE